MNALSSCCLQHLDSLCNSEGGKSNPFLSEIKYSVVLGHEGDAQSPNIGHFISHNTAKAIGGTLIPKIIMEG
jgi:hypothetical protein